MTQLFNQKKSIFTLFEQLDLDALIYKANYVINLCDENVFKAARNHSDLTLANYHGKPIHLFDKLPINVLNGGLCFLLWTLHVILKNQEYF